MRLSDFLLLSIFGAVMITGTGLIIGDLNTNYGSSMNISQIDSVMNTSLIENKSLAFQADITAASNSSSGFVSQILNGIGASTSLVGLFMASVGELFSLGGTLLGTVFGINSTIASLITGAIVTIVALLLISIPFRWEMTR